MSPIKDEIKNPILVCRHAVSYLTIKASTTTVVRQKKIIWIENDNYLNSKAAFHKVFCRNE